MGAWFTSTRVALSVFYTKKMELYSDLPDCIPNLPSFGPEDVPVGPVGHHQEEQEHDDGGVGEHEVGEQGEEGEALAQEECETTV